MFERIYVKIMLKVINFKMKGYFLKINNKVELE